MVLGTVRFAASFASLGLASLSLYGLSALGIIMQAMFIQHHSKQRSCSH